MELKVNGEVKSVTGDRLTIAGLLKQFNVEMPDMVSVQVNGAFIDRKVYETTSVNNKDEVDFLYFMGGGQ